MNPAPDQTNPIVTFWQTWKWVIILGAGSTVAICIALVLLIQTAQTSTPIQFSSDSDVLGGQTEEEQGIHVDIEGAVVSPGIQTLPAGSRVEDVLVSAGGFTENADLIYAAKVLNRAQEVTDGMKIYVPFLDQDETSYNSGSQENGTDTSHNISTGENTQDGQAGTLISINAASQAELDTLAGVGPVTANKIITNRPYQTLEDLINKKVIGVTLFEKIKSRLAL
jgi:competence protein ComEA